MTSLNFPVMKFTIDCKRRILLLSLPSVFHKRKVEMETNTRERSPRSDLTETIWFIYLICRFPDDFRHILLEKCAFFIKNGKCFSFFLCLCILIAQSIILCGPSFYIVNFIVLQEHVKMYCTTQFLFFSIRWEIFRWAINI